jgi:hypothetical protein
MGSNHQRGRIKKNLFLLIFVFIVGNSFGQIGGRYAYEFLGLPVSARLTALGGNLISVAGEDDVNLAMSNPANLDSLMHNSVSFSHNFHFAGISNGHAAHGRHIERLGVNVHGGVSYINYGNFVRADEFGDDQGDFTGSENTIVFGASKQINEKITIGGNLKGVFGRYDNFSSSGIAADFGVNYAYVPNKVIISMVIKNLGSELTTFGENRHAAPLDIQIGFSNRLKYLPFRFSIIAHQLQRWGIRYDDPNNDPGTDIFGTTTEKSAFSREVDNLFRHFVFNGEFLLGRKENLRLRIGYNHLRKKELSSTEFRSIAGFSLGFGIKISKFRLDYGVGYHHLVGAVNHMTISTNLNQFKRKRLINK